MGRDKKSKRLYKAEDEEETEEQNDERAPPRVENNETGMELDFGNLRVRNPIDEVRLWLAECGIPAYQPEQPDNVALQPYNRDNRRFEPYFNPNNIDYTALYPSWSPATPRVSNSGSPNNNTYRNISHQTSSNAFLSDINMRPGLSQDTQTVPNPQAFLHVPNNEPFNNNYQNMNHFATSSQTVTHELYVRGSYNYNSGYQQHVAGPSWVQPFPHASNYGPTNSNYRNIRHSPPSNSNYFRDNMNSRRPRKLKYKQNVTRFHGPQAYPHSSNNAPTNNAPTNNSFYRNIRQPQPQPSTSNTPNYELSMRRGNQDVQYYVPPRQEGYQAFIPVNNYYSNIGYPSSASSYTDALYMSLRLGNYDEPIVNYPVAPQTFSVVYNNRPTNNYYASIPFSNAYIYDRYRVRPGDQDVLGVAHPTGFHAYPLAPLDNGSSNNNYWNTGHPPTSSSSAFYYRPYNMRPAIQDTDEVVARRPAIELPQESSHEPNDDEEEPPSNDD